MPLFQQQNYIWERLLQFALFTLKWASSTADKLLSGNKLASIRVPLFSWTSTLPHAQLNCFAVTQRSQLRVAVVVVLAHARESYLWILGLNRELSFFICFPCWHCWKLRNKTLSLWVTKAIRSTVTVVPRYAQHQHKTAENTSGHPQRMALSWRRKGEGKGDRKQLWLLFA